MSKEKRNKPQEDSFSGPNTKYAVVELLKAYQSGKLDELDSYVTITVRGGDLSPEAKDFLRDKPV